METSRVIHKTDGISDLREPLVIHVRPEPRPQAGRIASAPLDRSSEMDQRLATAGLAAVCFPDVYRALARLLARGAPIPAAVLVCVDGLDDPEFEFFSLVSRARPALRVYVYSPGKSEGWIERAISLGAAGPVTDDTLGAIRDGGRSDFVAPADPEDGVATAPPTAASAVAEPSLIPRTIEEPEPQAPVPASPTHRVEDAPEREQEHVAFLETRDPPAQADAPGPPRSDETPGHTGEQGAPPPPARVPWLRYNDEPKRVAPSHRVPPSALPVRAAPTPPPPSEPLLTEEELRALIGTDDIAALAPDAQPKPGGHESNDGGRRP